MVTRNCQYRIVQEGSLPLRPDDEFRHGVPHACTSVLVWPEGERPNRENTFLTDPCFHPERIAQVESVLSNLGIDLADIGRIYITHSHNDHLPNVAGFSDDVQLLFGVLASQLDLPAGLSVVPCPGHHPLLASLVLETNEGTTWITGDAILDTGWLRAWRYYWPNRYSRDEIVETWRSVAKILSQADMIIPGHGPAFRVDESLIDDLLEGFLQADHAGDCPDVLQSLFGCMEQLRAN